MFTLDKVYKSYGSSTALQETTLKIDDGEFFVLVGASGGGKTTFLKLLNRLLEPTGGTILRDNRDIRSIRCAICALIRDTCCSKSRSFPT